LRADGTRESLVAEGPLLGIFDSDFQTGEVIVRPGDRV
jgi:serine phosphatase RsbU (regulator of sigma subunit)